MIFSAYYSFTNYGVQQIAGIAPTKTVGLKNYRQLFARPVRRGALKNTFVYGLMMVPAQIIVALLLALILMRIGEQLGGIFRTIFYMPHITPPVAIGVLVPHALQRPLRHRQQGARPHRHQGPVLDDRPALDQAEIAIMDVWACGGTMVILLAALYGVPRQLYEAAAMDGASKMRQFFNITLPMISPALFFCFIILTLAGLNQFTQSRTPRSSTRAPRARHERAPRSSTRSTCSSRRSSTSTWASRRRWPGCSSRSA